MNCDEAFDALTCPDSESDSALKWHLEMCPRCREMREVLAPALALFSEEESPRNAGNGSIRESHRLTAEDWEIREDRPRTAPFLTPEAVQVAEQTAKALHPQRRQERKNHPRLFAVAMVGLLAAIGAFLLASSTTPSHRAEGAPVMLADQCLWKNPEAAHKHADQENAASSRWVVLSCVACHLESTLD